MSKESATSSKNSEKHIRKSSADFSSNSKNSLKKSKISKEKMSAAPEYYSSPASSKQIHITSTIIACFVTLVIGIVIGCNWDTIYAKLVGKETQNTQDINFKSLNEVYKTLATDFNGDIDRDKVIEEAKRGLVNAAGDKYTYYMTAEEAQEFDKDLEGDVGAGIGIEFGERDGVPKVLRTTEDNPARRAGVLAGDIIYKADGEEIYNLNTDKIADKLRGAEGTKVVLTVLRDGEEIDFELIREKINNEAVYMTYRNSEKTAVMTVTRFDSNTGELARKKAEELKKKSCDKVILDLRNNGGGYVSAAREVASLWVDGLMVVEQRSKIDSYNEKTYAETGKAILKDIKTIVLINGGTASASEIVAGALRDYNKATLIGEKTYGKGSVQALEDFRDGSRLRVSIADWYTPNGQNINGDGLKPDKEVERTFEQINKEKDPQLDAALAY